MNNDLKVVLGILAVVLVVVAGTTIVIIAMRDSQQNTNTNPIVTTAPTIAPTVSSVDVKFSLWYTDGTAMPVATAYSVESGYYNIVTYPLQFTYYPTSFSNTTFVIHNDGNVPINVTATIVNENTPANSQVYLSNFAYPANSLILGVGQSFTANVVTILEPVGTNVGASVAGDAGSTYSFELGLSATQAS
jgi:hypothetical protein